MFEITIKNLETGEIKETIQADGLLLVGVNEDDEKPDKVVVDHATIEMMSTALACDVDLRSACRLAIAKWDSFVDKSETEAKEKMKGICAVLETLKTK